VRDFRPSKLIEECLLYGKTLKYSWWGESSIEIESFCRSAIIEANEMTAK
jgi:hypothetical protein